MSRITHLNSRLESLPLTRPYTIAYRTISTVEIVLLEVHTDDGRVGLGAANPSPKVVRETPAETLQALQSEDVAWLVGQDIRELPRLTRELSTRFAQQPGVMAAIDIALHDLFAQQLGLPLARCLGQAHEALPTSITIGIKDVAETLAEAEEYVAAGFSYLKIKLGHSLEEDLARLHRLREVYGRRIHLRVDANQGYDLAELQQLHAAQEHLQLELIEQPLPVKGSESLRGLPLALRAYLAADESLVTPADAYHLAQEPRAVGIFNIKLMKCGGIAAAMRIAAVADLAGIDLMWGCNDESIISISAALHTAFACPRTRYLDLDGSLDLARTWVQGGFRLDQGMMRLTEAPGLGVRIK
jgi:L-alanine-DL-glutamate epimerase-like enolase superfamily enzyme